MNWYGVGVNMNKQTYKDVVKVCQKNDKIIRVEIVQ